MSDEMKLKNCVEMKEFAAGTAFHKKDGEHHVIINLRGDGIEVQFSFEKHEAEIIGQGILEAAGNIEESSEASANSKEISLSEILADMKKEIMPSILEGMADDKNVPDTIRKAIKKELKKKAA